jgi:hypothetical protein
MWVQLIVQAGVDGWSKPPWTGTFVVSWRTISEQSWRDLLRGLYDFFIVVTSFRLVGSCGECRRHVSDHDNAAVIRAGEQGAI